MQQARPTVFRNGHIFDGLRHRPGFGVVVSGGRILAVGPDQEIGQLATGGHEVDLAGGIVMPGFQDAHVHPVLGGLEMMRCDLSAVATREECLREVARYATSHQEVDWVRGGGWTLPLFGPRGPAVSDLDAVVPDRPATPGATRRAPCTRARCHSWRGMSPRPPRRSTTGPCWWLRGTSTASG